MDDIIPQVETWILGNYAATAASVLQAVFNLPGNGTDKQCQAETTMALVCESMALIATNALFALRVYAIYNKNRVILGITLVFIISKFGLDILSIVVKRSISTIGSQYQDFSRCGGTASNVNEFTQGVNQAYICNDFLIHAVQMHRLGQPGITQVIIRDAFLYFLVITIKVTLKSGNSNNFSGFVTPFFNILPNLLISRLMLNLRTYSESGNTTTSEGQQTHVSSLNFASNQMLGNIGAPLDGGSFNEKEEAEEDGMEMEGFRA
ncbi:hypothetical protein C8R41DRAFT_871934 [Lentinula lateritia]|uniref:Uncharacterized protein n=1 Tax=Lentinula lateritia TaxID=40482 RepID=A0ABQ8V0C3_9AGAR|nr:hypothetical protein C8R41DRAFT_871934 [Lentinula lateritia]